MFYVYKWFNTDTLEIFYIGKGCGNRYKQVSKRNLKFLEYYKTHNCSSEIIASFENEEDAFKYEYEKIITLKKQGFCSCNLDDGGTGGVNFCWTPEMRQYKSEHNPMKAQEQRQRMKDFNPMSNPQIARKVAKKRSKMVIYKNEETTTRELCEKYHICIATAQRWAKRGYDTNGEPCYYKEDSVPKIQKKTSSKTVIIDGVEFPSLRSAADFLGVKDTSPLCRALKLNKTYKGHKCEYANQQPSDTNLSKSSIEGSTTNE